ncbi:MAG: endonuclease/exonuclease/phosphatase family protein [Bdellovibrionales bacterium]|nr:endonuclease/exonuclease/phosphatase family protein [Bdellovibrionales bacterium]
MEPEESSSPQSEKSEKPRGEKSRVLTALSALALPVVGALSCQVLPRAPEEAQADVTHGAVHSDQHHFFSRPFKCVSLNAWGKPDYITGMAPSRFEEVARFLEQEEVDVVALQEVWFERSREIFLHLRGVDVAESPFRDSLFLKSGLVTVSRFPIRESLSYRFTAESGIQALAEKGALFSALELPGNETLHVWNIHLQSGNESAHIREKQVEELCEWIEAKDDGSPLLVMGDFNCGPGSDAFDRFVLSLQDKGHIEVSNVGSTYDPSLNSFASGEESLVLDFVVSVTRSPLAGSPRFDRIFDEDDLVSDHFGIFSQMSFTERRETPLAVAKWVDTPEEPKE